MVMTLEKDLGSGKRNSPKCGDNTKSETKKGPFLSRSGTSEREGSVFPAVTAGVWQWEVQSLQKGAEERRPLGFLSGWL